MRTHDPAMVQLYHQPPWRVPVYAAWSAPLPELQGLFVRCLRAVAPLRLPRPDLIWRGSTASVLWRVADSDLEVEVVTDNAVSWSVWERCASGHWRQPSPGAEWRMALLAYQSRLSAPPVLDCRRHAYYDLVRRSGWLRQDEHIPLEYHFDAES